jgi:zinc transport system substrate-binding protein
MLINRNKTPGVINFSLVLLLIITIVFPISGCNNREGAITIEKTDINIITTLFPQYDFTKQIAKEHANVSLLLPPGLEAHSYDPPPQDIVRIRNADLFIYTGKYMEPWVGRLIEGIQEDKLIVVDVSKGIELIDEDEQHEHHGHGHEHSSEGKDPHIWLDPIYAQKMIDNIVEGLIQIDLDNKNIYIKNAKEYKMKLQDLHNNYITTFNSIENKKIMFGGHFAFRYFAKRYGLEYASPYEGFAPDAEPSPQKVAELISNIQETGLKYIYYEELVEPRVAQVISEGSGAEMLLLHAAHNISKDEYENGITYLEIMEENLKKLKLGLGYHE